MTGHRSNSVPRDRLRILHLIDSLDAGGAEKVAVQLSNLSHRKGHRVWLGTTRRDGTLAEQIEPGVLRVKLQRKSRFDLWPLFRLARWCRTRGVGVIHCHGSAVYVGLAAKWLGAGSKLIWHDHYGNSLEHRRLPAAWILRGSVDGIITVSEILKKWLSLRLKPDPDRMAYIPNFSTLGDADSDPSLPGVPEDRIVMVANFRRQKDHRTAVEAFRYVNARLPKARLLLVGSSIEHSYEREIRDLVATLELRESVVFLGPREDVGAILRRCQVGILSSISEGLPLTLLEYGLTGLATAATDVGQVGQILGKDRRGLLVPPKEPRLLAGAITELLLEPHRAKQLGQELAEYVAIHHSAEATIAQVESLYHQVLDQP